MKKIKVSHKGRVCRFPACKIVLSIYNHGVYCYLHEDKLAERMRTKASLVHA